MSSQIRKSANPPKSIGERNVYMRQLTHNQLESAALRTLVTIAFGTGIDELNDMGTSFLLTQEYENGMKPTTSVTI